MAKKAGINDDELRRIVELKFNNNISSTRCNFDNNTGKFIFETNPQSLKDVLLVKTIVKNIPNILAKNAKILILTTNKEFLLNEKEYKRIQKRTAQVGDTTYYLITCCLKKILSSKEEKN